MEPEVSRFGFFSKQFDDGPQTLMADDDNRSRRWMVRGREPAQQDEVPVLQGWTHAGPRHANDPEAQQRADALTRMDQSTG